jgi:prolyl oligopeptidase
MKSMKTFARLAGLTAGALFFAQVHAQSFTPPATVSQPVVDNVHGIRLTDPFRWLEDKTAPQVQQWTRTQHDATMRWLDATAPSSPSLRDELARFIDRTIVSAPRYYRGQPFFTKKQKGEAQAKLYTRLDGKEIMLFDPVALDPTGKTALSNFEFAPHDTLMSVAVQRAGSEIDDAHFIDRRTGAVRYPPLPGVWGLRFGATPGALFFGIRNKALIDAQKPLNAYTLKLGEPLSAAVVTIENDDAKNFVSTEEPERSPFVLTSRGDNTGRTYTIQSIDRKTAPQVLFSSKTTRADVQLVGNFAYLRSNDGANNFKLDRADLTKPIALKTLLPEKQDAVLRGVAVTRTHIIAREKRNLQHELRAYTLEGTPDARALTPPEPGDVASVAYDHHEDQLYVSLNTFNAPLTLYRVDPKSFAWTKVFQDESAVDTSQIETKRVDIPTRDGKRVPAFISMKKGTVLDGKQPVLLYGYGGFNIGMTTRYLGGWVPLINRGVIYVEAGLRGGDEFGEAWHQDGMLFKKQNTFNDFIDAAQWLIDNNYTNPQKLAIMGGSNGGLLVGAAATQRPDLFKAVVCSVPLLDMVRFHKFLIARYWITEYGDPEKAADFRNILSYSPYHAIRSGVELPAMMVIAGENDSRVDPLHAKKFVARAQANAGQTNPVLLKMDFDSGHGAGKSTQQLIDDREVWMRFILSQIGEK